MLPGGTTMDIIAIVVSVGVGFGCIVAGGGPLSRTQCFSCHRWVQRRFLFCPHCGKKLRQASKEKKTE
jgi:predicted amidophosphoribosyltransferase